MKTLNPLLILTMLILIWSCKDDDTRAEVPKENAYQYCCQNAEVEFDWNGSKVYIPNIFTPNGDGINDVFLPFAGENIVEILNMKTSGTDNETLFFKENFSPNEVSGGWGLNEIIDHEGSFTYTIRVRNTADEIGVFSGFSCAYICKTETDSLLPGNIENCRFPVQHDGAGGFDESFPSLESSDCF